MGIQWPEKDPTKIIIRMPNWIGDLVMATPLLTDLRNRYQDAEITAMCQANVAPLLEKDRDIDQVLSFKKRSGWLHGHRKDIIDPLRFGHYDLGVLTTNSFSSALWFWRGKVKNRIGFKANFRSFMLNKAIPFPENRESQHLVLTYKKLLEPLGLSISETEPRLFISNEEEKRVKTILKSYNIDTEKHTIVGINPGAAYGTAKCWLPDRFSQVAKRLLENPDVRILFFGDQTTSDLINSICSDLPDTVVNLAGKTTLRELVSIIGICDAFLSNDSGPMHIAAALKTPLVAIFGSTSEVKTGPYKHGSVIHKHMPCSPCYKRVCPIDFRCMTSIEVDEVVDELSKQLCKKEKLNDSLKVVN